MIGSCPQALTSQENRASSVPVLHSKLDLVPSQCFTYLGARYNLMTYLISPTRVNFLKVWAFSQPSLQQLSPSQKVATADKPPQQPGEVHSVRQEMSGAYTVGPTLSVEDLPEQAVRSCVSHQGSHKLVCTEEQVLKCTLLRLPDPSVDIQIDASTAGWGVTLLALAPSQVDGLKKSATYTSMSWNSELWSWHSNISTHPQGAHHHVHRQYHSDDVHIKAGKSRLMGHVLGNRKATLDGRGQHLDPLSQICSGSPQCPSRPTFPQAPGKAEQELCLDWVQDLFLHWGSPIWGFGGSTHRCTLHHLGQHERICIPFSTDHPAGPGEDQQVSDSMSDTYHTAMGEIPLGQRTLPHHCRRPCTPPPVAPPAQTVPHGCLPQGQLNLHAWIIARQGYSAKMAECICEPQTKSTRDIYQGKWKIFVTYCEDRDIDPWQATVPQICEFLSYIFEMKEMMPTTVDGYHRGS